MDLKEYIKKHNMVEEKYFEEFFETYGHITKIPTLKLLANEFIKQKNKEIEFNPNKYKNEFKFKYPNINDYIQAKQLKQLIFMSKIKDKMEYQEAEDLIFNEERIIELQKYIYNGIFNNLKHGRDYKNSDFFNSLIKEGKTLKEINDELPNIIENIEKQEIIFKEEKEKRREMLLSIIKPDSIETHYPEARKIKRTIHLYLGPTNSGKTHQAINILKEAKSGLYLAPLRLLAREIFDDLTEKKIKTTLITGEERIVQEKATHICSTIEMTDLNKKYEVAVIDEIQFLADKDRGNAWTRCLLGLEAKDIIVVGSLDSKDLILQIAELCGDNIIELEFNRLSPLEIEEETLEIEDLNTGDALIAFSRKDVHKIAEYLQVNENKKVSIIYGSLPPEVKIEESRRFNEGETDLLVSTDAIGYGLNLNISRVIFTTMTKFDGEQRTVLDQSTFNQISGRAGRYGKKENGRVAYLPKFSFKNEEGTFNRMGSKLKQPLPALKECYYFPEWEVLEKIAKETKNKNVMINLLFDYDQLFKNKTFKYNYYFLETVVTELDKIEEFDLEMKYKLMFAPVRESNMDFFQRCLKAFIDKVPYETRLDVHLDRAKSLQDLELVSHNALLYMWLHQRYKEMFPSYEETVEVYKNVTEIIKDVLKEGY